MNTLEYAIAHQRLSSPTFSFRLGMGESSKSSIFSTTLWRVSEHLPACCPPSVRSADDVNVLAVSYASSIEQSLIALGLKAHKHRGCDGEDLV